MGQRLTILGFFHTLNIITQLNNITTCTNVNLTILQLCIIILFLFKSYVCTLNLFTPYRL